MPHILALTIVSPRQLWLYISSHGFQVRALKFGSNLFLPCLAGGVKHGPVGDRSILTARCSGCRSRASSPIAY